VGSKFKMNGIGMNCGHYNGTVVVQGGMQWYIFLAPLRISNIESILREKNRIQGRVLREILLTLKYGVGCIWLDPLHMPRETTPTRTASAT
jgi:hypothetical protein